MIGGFFRKLAGSARETASREPRLPPGVRIYAIGDIHGRLDLIERLYEKIEADRAQNPIDKTVEVFLGDYVDRGPSSKGVLDWLIAGPNSSSKRVTLQGNHELFLMEFLNDASVIGSWGQYGGLETLYSYGLRFKMPLGEDQWEDVQAQLRKVMPSQHLAFLRSCVLSSAMGGYFFAHAGVNPSVPLEAQVADDLLWIREPFLSYHKPLAKIIVHGHTPVEAPEIEPHRIGIDTGAFVTGKLTCAVLEGSDVRFLST
jgi:serine/threonine protein phosphatase 1